MHHLKDVTSTLCEKHRQMESYCSDDNESIAYNIILLCTMIVNTLWHTKRVFWGSFFGMGLQAAISAIYMYATIHDEISHVQFV